MESSNTCGVCGLPLVPNDKGTPLTCSFCGNEYEASLYCPTGHYFCESCTKLDPGEVLMQLLSKTDSKSPAEILEKVLSHPAISMHGPVHHFVVPAVIVAAAVNAGDANKNLITVAVERGMKVPGGWCGLYGDCGAAVGAGIAVSVLTRATPLTGKERSLALGATAFALFRMLDNAPRCCKKAARIAVESAVEYLEKNVGIALEKGRMRDCQYSPRNKECIREACPYFATVSK